MTRSRVMLLIASLGVGKTTACLRAVELARARKLKVVSIQTRD